MAGRKKQPELTAEENLQQALVPEAEQPYKMSDNWCWVHFKYISNIRTGKKDANYGSENGQYPFFTCAAEPICCDGYSFDCNAILLAGNGDINNISRFNGKFEAYQRTYVVETLLPFNIDYIYYFFKYKWLDYNKDKMFGTAIPYIRLGNLQEFPIPLPPLAEQQRIVERIETLFAKLDEAKEKLQNTLDTFETRKAAILHKAFTGELTANWRQQHGFTMDSWEEKKLSDVCEKIVCGKTPSGYINADGEIPFLKVYNIVNNRIAFYSKPQYISKNIHENKLKSSILKPNDIIMNIVGPPLRKIAIIPNDFPEWNMNQAIVRFRCKENLFYKYLYYALIYPKTLDEVIVETKGVVGQANISLTQSRNLQIYLPTLDEQTEIVRIIDNLLAKEQQAHSIAQNAITKIDLIKKSILARAFRGQFATNNPADEPAIELLKRVL